MIEGMDKSLGDLMEHLQKLGVEENTIVMFMSDNGAELMTPLTIVKETKRPVPYPDETSGKTEK